MPRLTVYGLLFPRAAFPLHPFCTCGPYPTWAYMQPMTQCCVVTHPRPEKQKEGALSNETRCCPQFASILLLAFDYTGVHCGGRSHPQLVVIEHGLLPMHASQAGHGADLTPIWRRTKNNLSIIGSNVGSSISPIVVFHLLVQIFFGLSSVTRRLLCMQVWPSMASCDGRYTSAQECKGGVNAFHRPAMDIILVHGFAMNLLILWRVSCD